MRLLFLWFLTIGLLSASSKVALVIGNSNYSQKPLPNAKQDAKDIRDKLIALGYDVVFAPNVNVSGFSQAITDFHNKVIGADIAVVFYAGHGIEIGGENYMIPLGVNTIYTRRDLTNLIKLSDVIAEAEIAKKFGVLFVDACRDNPLKNNIDPTIRSSVTRGLGQVDTPSNILVSFATKAKQVVNDGDGSNSPYTTALKKFISNQEDIRFVIGKVKDSVVLATKNSQVKQEPTMFGTLGGSRYCLSGTCEEQVKVVETIVYRDRVVEPTVMPKREPKPVRATSTSKWLKPSSSVCKANGGEMVKGACRANWENATKICSASGGRLPTGEDLKQVVVHCGGLFTTYRNKDKNSIVDKNTKNKSYQACYKEKGFIYGYWTREENNSSERSAVHFHGGIYRWYDKTKAGGTFCIL